MTNVKVDFKKNLKQFYNPKTIPSIVDVPPMQFLMIDGVGAVESKEFQEAIEALFSVSYKAKFIAKSVLNYDYTVMPLEGLWWADDMNDFVIGNKKNWKWTLMIMQPDIIDQQIIQSAINETKKKKYLFSLDLLRFQNYHEGLSAQIMHIGPFSEEHDSVMKIHSLIAENNGLLEGSERKHHEIYLSDFRKVEPMKMRTIIRQPFLKI